mgnify:FL=1
MRVIKNIPKNIFVLKIANASKTFETLTESICVIEKTLITKIAKYSIVKIPIDEEIMKNQNENPADTAIALNLGEETFIISDI